ncbi:GDP-mannose pyrophosphatase, partial [Mesorhizobium sp. M7A.F.Ca.MR.228.00.0.0]
MEDRIRVRSEEILSDDWAVLKKTVLDYRRRD